MITTRLKTIIHWLAAAFILFSNPTNISLANAQRVIKLNPKFGKPLRLAEPATTIAIGDPNVADVVTVEPNLLMITGQNNGSTSMTIIGQSGKIFQYTLLVAKDVTELRTLIHSVAPDVTVETIKNKILLKGTVETPAQLTRVLTVADRYMGGNSPTPRFRVISDQGGVLAGNLPETQAQKLSTLRLSTGGGGGGGGRGGGGGGGGGGGTATINKSNDTGKANLAQNISRANVIAMANGRVISMIEVLNQPKVEIQMRIVEIDRSKTDEFGIDWRLDGNKVSVSSFTGDVTSSLPSPTGNSPINFGTANLGAFFQPGKYTIAAFVRAIEQKGATTTLSEPLLTAISGEASQFLVGGSVPIPTQTQASSNNTVATATNVRYLNFGLSINVRPTVLENGKISIILDQAISEVDFTNGIQILGTQVPGFTQKTVSTVTESESGETWAVAGLLTEEDRKRLEGVPWISKVPILGNLFKNKNDSVSRNEMIILVNARRVDKPNSTTTSFKGRGRLEPYSNGNDIKSIEKNEAIPTNYNDVKPIENNEDLSANYKDVERYYTKDIISQNDKNISQITKEAIKSSPKLASLKQILPIGHTTKESKQNENITKNSNSNPIKVIHLNKKKQSTEVIDQTTTNQDINTDNSQQVVVKYFLEEDDKNKFIDEMFETNNDVDTDRYNWKVATGRLASDPQHKIFIIIEDSFEKKVSSGSILNALDMGNRLIFTAVN